MNRSRFCSLVVTGALCLAWTTTASALALDTTPDPPDTSSVETNQIPEAAGMDTNAPLARAIEPPRIALPTPLAEIVRLAESGMSDEVLLAYIQKSPAVQPLTADQILYLRDLGISATILTALIEYRPTAPPQSEPAQVPAPRPRVAAWARAVSASTWTSPRPSPVTPPGRG